MALDTRPLRSLLKFWAPGGAADSGSKNVLYVEDLSIAGVKRRLVIADLDEVRVHIHTQVADV